jgi:hypothetical protein
MPLEATLLVESPVVTEPAEGKIQVKDGPIPKYIPTDKSSIPIGISRSRIRTMVLTNTFLSSWHLHHPMASS